MISTSRETVRFTVADTTIDVDAFAENTTIDVFGDDYRAEFDVYNDRGHVVVMIDAKTIERCERNKGVESWHKDRISASQMLKIEKYLEEAYERENLRVRDLQESAA